MSEVLRVLWTIAPAIAPCPLLSCRRCGTTRPFRSSQTFRVNANGKRIDAWLIYRCVACESTWNRPLIERQHVGSVDPALLARLHRNDPELIRRIAFDTEGLRRSAGPFEESASVVVGKTVLAAPAGQPRRIEICVSLAHPVSLRVDRLLAHELRIPRSRILGLDKRGLLEIRPRGGRSLQRPVRNGTVIILDLSQEEDRDRIVAAA